MKNKIIISITIVVLIITITIGVTYSFIIAQGSANFATKTGTGITSNLTLETIKSSDNLVPLANDKVETAITKQTNKCLDKNNYEVCSLYKITVTNTKETESLYGYVKTISTTYTSDNLKYQIYDSNNKSITDVMTISRNENELIYFTKDQNRLSLTSTGTSTYYLVIWLSDPGTDQTDIDSSNTTTKKLNGKIGFELVGTDSSVIEATF